MHVEEVQAAIEDLQHKIRLLELVDSYTEVRGL